MFQVGNSEDRVLAVGVHDVRVSCEAYVAKLEVRKSCRTVLCLFAFAVDRKLDYVEVGLTVVISVDEGSRTDQSCIWNADLA